MSTLLNQLADPNYRPPTGPSCGMAVILANADKKTADLVIKACANPYAPSTQIAEALTEQGHRVSAHTVQRHRKGQCRCPKATA